jgi:hypothetical protein
VPSAHGAHGVADCQQQLQTASRGFPCGNKMMELLSMPFIIMEQSWKSHGIIVMKVANLQGLLHTSRNMYMKKQASQGWQRQRGFDQKPCLN